MKLRDWEWFHWLGVAVISVMAGIIVLAFGCAPKAAEPRDNDCKMIRQVPGILVLYDCPTDVLGRSCFVVITPQSPNGISVSCR